MGTLARHLSHRNRPTGVRAPCPGHHVDDEIADLPGGRRDFASSSRCKSNPSDLLRDPGDVVSSGNSTTPQAYSSAAPTSRARWRDFVQYQMSVKVQPCRNQ